VSDTPRTDEFFYERARRPGVYAWLKYARTIERELTDSNAELRRLHAVNAELQELIDGIYIYANDTLSGRVDGPDDRDWQRASVVEIRNRARSFSIVASARAAIAKAEEVKP